MDEFPVEEHDNKDNSSTKDEIHIANALNLTWSFGINKNVPVLNLSNSTRKVLFYTTAHTGVLYNFEYNTEVLYQGHCNAITCTCVSVDRRWLATADIGKDCMLIVWDTELSIPIKTIFDVDPVGVTTMTFSSCMKFIATLGSSFPQFFSVWDWTRERESPVISIRLDEMYGLQTFVRFDANDPFKLISNNGNQVMFYKWTLDGKLELSAPTLNNKDFNKTVGIYSQSIFKPDLTSALTATSCGNIVVWHELSQPLDIGINHKAFKIVQVQEQAITVLQLEDDYIVTGDVTGTVKFFDMELKLINWYNKFDCHGPINCVSFTYDHPQKHAVESQDPMYPTSSTLKATSFIVSDFSISTTKANYIYFKTDGSVVEYNCKENDNDVKAIACHPKSSLLAIGGFDGLLQVWDFETKCLVHKKHFTDNCVAITCLAYSYNGNYLAVGFDDGTVQVLDSLTLQVDGKAETKSIFHFSHNSIIKLVFSFDSNLLACCDDDRCVVVFKHQPKNESFPWYYLGKHRAHYKQIVDLLFTTALDENYPRLLSIGQDRMLIEYDLKNSCIDDLKVLTTERIEQDAIPTCITAYPPIVKEDFLLIANDKFKMKLFNSTTRMCRHTFLGPTYGSPIQRMVVLPGMKERSSRYMAYVTYDKVGLVILPLDGNPHRSMALIAHPGMVHNLTCSSDGKYIFTAGGGDTSVLMWKTDFNALEAAAALGGEDLIPFYSLLEGGREGELFAELEEYFYHAQLRNQGIDCMSQRDVSTEVPLKEIPFIMRALGFYPTEQQIDEMINEVKFSEYVATGKHVKSIDLSGLIKLYVNHRPAFGLSSSELIDAFNKLGIVDEDDGEVKIDRNELLKLLQDSGEHITEAELAEYMAILVDGPPDENQDDEDGRQSDSIDEILPEKLSARTFTSDVLGFSAEDTSVF